jgi:sec-independent protein translocase protein TatA
MPSWIGPWEIAIVLILALLIFGPRKLPDLGASLGKSIRGFKKGLKDAEDEVKSTVAEARNAGETTAEASTTTAAATAEPAPVVEPAAESTAAEPESAATTAEPDAKPGKTE